MTTDTRPPITFGDPAPAPPRLSDGSGQRVAFGDLLPEDDCPVCGERIAVDRDSDSLIAHEPRDREAASFTFGL